MERVGIMGWTEIRMGMSLNGVEQEGIGTF